MKTIKFLQESFETKERFQQEISIKYSYNRDTVESIDLHINQRNIRYFYEAMQNFENSLVNEFKEKKNNFCDANQFLESLNGFDKIIFLIITYMKSYFDLYKEEEQGYEDNYVFNLNIESDNQIGFSCKQLNYN